MRPSKATAALSWTVSGASWTRAISRTILAMAQGRKHKEKTTMTVVTSTTALFSLVVSPTVFFLSRLMMRTVQYTRMMKGMMIWVKKTASRKLSTTSLNQRRKKTSHIVPQQFEEFCLDWFAVISLKNWDDTYQQCNKW